MISGQKDDDFPPDGYHEVFQRSKRIYDLYAAETNEKNSDRVRELDDEVGHTDAPKFRRAAREWMRRWLQNVTEPLPETPDDPALESAADLACLEQLPADAINDRIHNQFTRTAAPKNWLRPGPGRRAEIIDGLKEKVFRWFPTDEIPFETQIARNTGGWVARYAQYKDVTFQTEVGVQIRAQLLSPTNSLASNPLLLYVKRPGDSIYPMDFDELLPVLGRCTVLILNPRFTERSLTAAEYRDLEMSAPWSGRTVAAMQTWDILRALEWIFAEEKLNPSSLSIYGKNEMGVLALYAALLDARVTEVILSNPPSSHWQGPALLNVLRVTDFPEVASALGKGRVISLTKIPSNFRARRAESLSQALHLSRLPAAPARVPP
jgi:hypothetical protein